MAEALTTISTRTFHIPTVEAFDPTAVAGDEQRTEELLNQSSSLDIPAFVDQLLLDEQRLQDLGLDPQELERAKRYSDFIDIKVFTTSNDRYPDAQFPVVFGTYQNLPEGNFAEDIHTGTNQLIKAVLSETSLQFPRVNGANPQLLLNVDDVRSISGRGITQVTAASKFIKDYVDGVSIIGTEFSQNKIVSMFENIALRIVMGPDARSHKSVRGALVSLSKMQRPPMIGNK